MKPSKEKALQALLVSRTRTEAAAVAGLGVSTLREYLKDPEFCAEYKKAAEGMIESATTQLQDSMTASICRLRAIVEDDNAGSMAQISAARSLLEYALKFTEFNDILRELEEREAIVL